MLDYKFIKDNLAAVKENIANRNMVADADKVVELYDKNTALTTKLQGLQQKRNENAQPPSGEPEQGDDDEGGHRHRLHRRHVGVNQGFRQRKPGG